jgi:hypothetical protein
VSFLFQDPPPRVDPKVLKLLRLAANNTSPEEAKSALDKALEMLEEPDYFVGARIATEHVGDHDTGFDLVLEVNSGGRFLVRYNGGAAIGTGDTRDQAIEAAKATLTKSRHKVKVPFVDEWGRLGTASGLSLSDGGLLCRDEENKPYTVQRHDTTYDGNMPAEDLAALRAAIAAEEQARQVISEIRSKHRFDLRQAVNEAITRAVL